MLVFRVPTCAVSKINFTGGRQKPKLRARSLCYLISYSVNVRAREKNAPAPGSAAGSAPAPGSAAASACSREQGDLARLQQGDLVLFLLWLAACGRFSTLQKATLWLRCQAPLLSGSGAGWMHRGPNAAQ